MNILESDLWSYESHHLIVVPTNMGWRLDGVAVMGKGVAKEASKKYPLLAGNYGIFLQSVHGYPRVPWYRFGSGPGVLMVPTKPLNPDEPHLSWAGKADLTLIARALVEMKKTLEHPYVPKDTLVVLPMLGCGEGGLKREHVIPLLRELLPESKYLLILKN